MSRIQYGCLVVKYLDFDSREIVTRLWEIIPMLLEFEDNHDVNSGRIYELISNSFTSVNIPLENIVAFGSDGCSTMMGAHNSVSQRFRQNNLNIIIVKCPSHSRIYVPKMQ